MAVVFAAVLTGWNFSRARDPRNIVINRVPRSYRALLVSKTRENCDVCLYFLSLYLYWFPLYLSLSLSSLFPRLSFSLSVSSPVFLLCVTSCPIHQSLVTTYGCYIIGHMVLIDVSLVDEWALVKSYLNAETCTTMKILEFLFAPDH